MGRTMTTSMSEVPIRNQSSFDLIEKIEALRASEEVLATDPGGAPEPETAKLVYAAGP